MRCIRRTFLLGVLVLLLCCAVGFPTRAEAAEVNYVYHCTDHCRPAPPEIVVRCTGIRRPVDGGGFRCDGGQLEPIETYISNTIATATKDLETKTDSAAVAKKQREDFDALNQRFSESEGTLSKAVETRVVKALLERIEKLEARLTAIESR